MDYIKIYKEKHLADAIDRGNKARRLIEAFRNDYPIDSIADMTMEEYVFTPAKDGPKGETFCNRIDGEMDAICHSGNVRPNIYGIYSSAGSVKVSPTFASCDDDETAFKIIKQEILFLLRGFGKGNYDAVKKCRLNSSFKYKLLAIYYPDEVIPVQTRWLLDDYCNRIGIMDYPKEEMIYRNIALRKWKERNPETKDWNNSTFMCFCDWLVRSNIKLD